MPAAENCRNESEASARTSRGVDNRSMHASRRRTACRVRYEDYSKKQCKESGDPQSAPVRFRFHMHRYGSISS